MKKHYILMSALALTSTSQAKAWTYTCASQSISHKTLDYLSITDAYGDFASLRSSIDGQPMPVPTLTANGENDFVSHDGDVEVSINPMTDENEMMSIDLKIKSLGVHGTLDCKQVGL